MLTRDLFDWERFTFCTMHMNTDELFVHPLHPYTEALMSAVPKPDPRVKMDRILLEGDVADPASPPSGCCFHPRCRYAQDRCSLEEPVLREVGAEHFVSCHFAQELHLRGVVADQTSV